MKRNLYLLLILIGVIIASVGHWAMEEEYAMMIGMVLLMFGLYKTTQLWNIGREDEDGDQENQVEEEKNEV